MLCPSSGPCPILGCVAPREVIPGVFHWSEVHPAIGIRVEQLLRRGRAHRARSARPRRRPRLLRGARATAARAADEPPPQPPHAPLRRGLRVRGVDAPRGPTPLRAARRDQGARCARLRSRSDAAGRTREPRGRHAVPGRDRLPRAWSGAGAGRSPTAWSAWTTARSCSYPTPCSATTRSRSSGACALRMRASRRSTSTTSCSPTVNRGSAAAATHCARSSRRSPGGRQTRSGRAAAGSIARAHVLDSADDTRGQPLRRRQRVGAEIGQVSATSPHDPRHTIQQLHHGKLRSDDRHGHDAGRVRRSFTPDQLKVVLTPQQIPTPRDGRTTRFGSRRRSGHGGEPANGEYRDEPKASDRDGATKHRSRQGRYDRPGARRLPHSGGELLRPGAREARDGADLQAASLCCSASPPSCASAAAYRALEVVGVPILLVRGGDGEVRAFVNMCTHRGAQVVDEGSGRQLRFACPYHAWTFDDYGRPWPASSTRRTSEKSTTRVWA